MAAEPARRARRGHRLGQVGRQRADEVDRADDRARCPREGRGRSAPCGARGIRAGAGRRSDVRSRRRTAARQADIMPIASSTLVRVTEIGQQLGEQALPSNSLSRSTPSKSKMIASKFSVSPRTGRCRSAPRSRQALPRLKSADIPMLKPMTSWRRASLASSAKYGAGSTPSGGIAISPASGSVDARTARPARRSR